MLIELNVDRNLCGHPQMQDTKKMSVKISKSVQED